MAENENDLQFSVKEIKELSSEQSETAQSAEGAPVRARRSFIEDTDSLLADIRSTVDEDVASEAARIAKQDAERAEERRSVEQAEHEARQAEIQSMIAAEENRRKAVTAELDRMRLSYETPEEEEEPEQDFTQADVEQPPAQHVEAPARFEVESAATQTEPTRGNAFYIGIVSVVILILVAVVGVALRTPEPTPSTVPTVQELNVGSPLPVTKKAPAEPAVTAPAPGQTTPSPTTASASPGADGEAKAMGSAQEKAAPTPKKRIQKKKKSRKIRAKASKKRPSKKAKKAKKKSKVKKKFNIKLGGDGLNF